MNNMAQKSNCDTCVFYVYDDDCDCYVCTVNLDEDEMVNFLSFSTNNCPNYRLNDEYGIVKKQM